ncbi:ComF family protein [Dactylosporangium sp. AC04546]|uniref:ComF family protein n=1 Tax=Dactylosporangium sp. AC04546 TaxID=2862460 RepID=UPI001EE12778|nr:ComF family protein [Dactylosporangium sp. AC04546]WVK82958.1 ComF family protein [Dactylosporangium sp. AC04546]
MFLADLVDLVLPAVCAGCEEPARGALCGPCRAALRAASPQRTRPDPEPQGMPVTYALAAYAGSVRGALLQYKEKGRRELTRDLGEALARVVVRALSTPAGPPGSRASVSQPSMWTSHAPASQPPMWAGRASASRPLRRASHAPPGHVRFGTGGRPVGQVVLVPVPATAAAVRERHGDHVLRLAKVVAGMLPDASVVMPLRALPKRGDSAELSAAERAVAARQAFALRARGVAELRARVADGAAVVVVDDIVTTGVTLAAAAGWVARATEGGTVPRAAVLAATQRRRAT